MTELTPEAGGDLRPTLIRLQAEIDLSLDLAKTALATVARLSPTARLMVEAALIAEERAAALMGHPFEVNALRQARHQLVQNLDVPA